MFRFFVGSAVLLAIAIGLLSTVFAIGGIVGALAVSILGLLFVAALFFAVLSRLGRPTATSGA